MGDHRYSKRIKAYKKVGQQNRMLRAMLDVNRIIGREKDRMKLLNAICDRLLKIRGYSAAWMVIYSKGFIEIVQPDKNKKFYRLANEFKKGYQTPCIVKAKIEKIVTASPSAKCLACLNYDSCINSSRIVTIALERKYLYGYLTVALQSEDTQDEDEMSLLSEIGSDVAYALNYLEEEENRYQREMLLIESEERNRVFAQIFSKAFFVSVIPTALTRLSDSLLVKVNEAFCQFVGYRQDELTGRTTVNLNLWAYPSERENIISQLKINGFVRDVEITVKDKFGGLHSCLFTANILDFNTVPHMISMIIDVSKLKYAEEKFKNLFYTMTLGVVYQDIKGQIVSANPAAERILGLSMDQMIGKFSYDPDCKAIHEDGSLFKEDTHPGIETLKSGKEIHSVVMGVYNPSDGGYRWINIDAIPVFRYKESTPFEVYTIFDDITDRKKLENELRENEEKFQILYEQSLLAIAIIQKGLIKYANKAFSEFSGYSLDEIYQWQSFEYSKLVYSEDREFVLEQSIKKQKAESNAIFNYTFRGVNKYNKLVWCELYSKSIKYRGESAVLVTLIDLSKRKEAEEKLEKLNAELIEKNSELEQILYTVSHDLRSPLVNIQGFSRELKNSVENLSHIIRREDIPPEIMEIINPINDDIIDSLKFISSSAIKMDTLLRGLLRLSRLGRASLLVVELDMNNLLMSVLYTFEYLIKEQDVSVIVEKLPRICGDEAQIEQVFSNLISNALKYLDPRRKGIIKISGRQEKDRAYFYIEDNGIGIEKDHQKMIFNIFHRLNPNDTPGDGLGLTIAKKIIERHNGEIWIESEFGKGSKLNVKLPLMNRE